MNSRLCFLGFALVACMANFGQANVIVNPGSLFTWDTVHGPQVPSGVVPDNLALASSGAAAFAYDEWTTGGTIAGLNDGNYGLATSECWIGNDAPASIDLGGTWGSVTDDGFAGIRLASPTYITSFAFGRDNKAGNQDRNAGTFYVQLTTVPNPDETTADASWITIGSISIDGGVVAYGADPLNADDGLRHEFTLTGSAAMIAATGLRIIVPNVNQHQNAAAPFGEKATCIDEIEVYGSAAQIPEPSTLVLLGSALIGLLCYPWRKRTRSTDC